MPKREIVDVSLNFIRETDKAICCSEVTTENNFWLPKSQIEYEIKGSIVEVTLPLWLAQEKKLAGY